MMGKVGMAICFLAVCGLDGGGLELAHAVAMTAAGLPMVICGIRKSEMFY